MFSAIGMFPTLRLPKNNRKQKFELRIEIWYTLKIVVTGEENSKFHNIQNEEQSLLLV